MNRVKKEYLIEEAAFDELDTADIYQHYCFDNSYDMDIKEEISEIFTIAAALTQMEDERTARAS